MPSDNTLEDMSDADLEATRVEKQHQRDTLHVEMHAIVQEQETRRARIEMAKVLRALPEGVRKALLAEGAK